MRIIQHQAYCGIDTHKHTHTAKVVDCWLNPLGEITFENRPGKFDSFLKKIKIISGSLIPIFGLEDTKGYGRNLAVYLTGHKFIVKQVNPAYTSTARRSAPTVYKDDSYDAFCIAKTLRDMNKQLPDANQEDIFWTVRQLVKRRDTLANSAKMLQNQLHVQLVSHYPSYKQFFTLLTCTTALYFWEKYPSPKHLTGIAPEQLGKELRQIGRNACSTRKAQQILSLIEADGEQQKAYQSERDFVVQSMVKEIRYKCEAIKEVEQQLQHILPHTGYQLETMPGINLITASRIISEIGDIHRFSNADKLARFAGIAPVHFSSAGKGKEQRSKQGNRVLNSTLYFLAVQLLSVRGGKARNPAFHEYFERKVKEGKKKSQAIICIQRRLINIIYGMMKNKTAYKL
ncbi:Transposase [Dendrosporobacter quercicolus]|uniref:Transposase n=1 Tax=Dendrosporobacter quercicolus TaxID=146817 RepID=A0A1G9W160_9FIRM|nr:Transposase [Dendrosporobacter quercicolus]